MHQLLASLNPKQRQAVQATDGPVLILAGAGSGKTKTLIHRIAYLMATGKARSEQILAVTFTNKAAQEMKSRLAKLLGGAVSLPLVGTFHSVCAQLLRQEIELLGYRSRFVIYDDNDTSSLIKNIMKELGYDPKKVSPTVIKALISRAKNELKDPAAYEAEADEPIEQTVAHIYNRYQNTLKQNNALDFDDLIRLTVTLLKEHPQRLQHYQSRLKYILVDEYQDTNHAQFILINLLAQKHNNICVVGDDYQCITPNTKIKTPNGWKQAKQLHVGDAVISGSGRGSTMTSYITRKYSKKVSLLLYEITVKSGKKILLTPNHILFARLTNNASCYYVYLMYRQHFGYRIGMVQGIRTTKHNKQNGLIVRGNQERADKIWILRTCKTKQEAQYWEMYLAFYYGIPTIIFCADNLTSLNKKDVYTLFKNINTTERVKKLCQDLQLNLNFPHHRPSGTTRFKTERKILRLDWFADTRRTIRSPWCATRLALHTTNKRIKKILLQAGYTIRKSKKDTWRHELSQLNIARAEQHAQILQSKLPNTELVRSAWLTSTKKNVTVTCFTSSPINDYSSAG